MLYACVRAVVALALRLFYRVQVQGAAQVPAGPVILVGNHPNGLVDPALVFILTGRRVTFLAKEPLFRLPLLGGLLRGMGALPVLRRQEGPAQAGGNEGTFEAATRALVAGGAITVFPEGKSHDAPHLAELKTGTARIALRAVRAGAPVQIIPVGLTYAQKHRFRSEVRLEVGPPLEARAFFPPGAEEAEGVRALTEAMARALGQVTLNLERWEDLPLVETAEALWALRHGTPAGDPERLRRFARGVALLRREEAGRFVALREALRGYRRRLGLVRARPSDLALVPAPAAVGRFVLRSLAEVLVGGPLCALGLLLFAVPYPVPGLVARAARVPLDVEATVKLLVTLVLAPLWLLLLAGGAWAWGGPRWGLGLLVGAPPLALVTRALLERWREALRDAARFLALEGRAGLRFQLLREGERLAEEVARAAEEYGPRTLEPVAPRAGEP